MKQAIFSILLLLTASTFSQATIKLEEVKGHVGYKVHVCDLVTTPRYIIVDEVQDLDPNELSICDYFMLQSTAI